MLRSVSVSDIAIIKELSFDFEPGFTVLTGETGAGKSILIDSIAFVLGARADRDMIRTGEDTATVTAVFDGAELQLSDSLGVTPDEYGEITLTRTLTSDGRSSAKINGKSVPIAQLREVGKSLMAIHGQQDTGALSEKSELIELLDGFVFDEGDLDEYRSIYSKLCALAAKRDELISSLKDKTMMLDILEYQFNEISGAKLSDPDEEDKLILLRNKLRSIEKVAKNVSVVKRAILDNERGVTVSYMLDRASGAISALSEVCPESEDLVKRIDEIKYELIDISETVSALISDDDMSDPEKKLDAVEKRLSVIKKLKGKYGETIPDVIAKREEIKKRIDELRRSDETLCDLDDEISSVTARAEASAAALSERRKSGAAILTRDILSVLGELDMPGVRFKIGIDKRHTAGKTDFDRYGFDDVDFFVSANVGEEMQPISKIASGGELSRIMLAIKSALSKKTSGVTSVYDEIDAGVSGGTSERIGRLLREMSQKSQIICITHSAQIASLADCHLLISKSETDGRVESRVERLDREGRIKELSRIIGGINITEKQIRAAEEMLQRSER